MKHLFGIPLFATLVAAGFTLQAQAASDAVKQRAAIRTQCNETLATLYKAKPEARREITRAPGYGCFSNFGITFLVGGAGGQGLVHDNKTGKDTYMNFGQVSGGIEIGIKNYREVLVFKDTKTLRKFIDTGWEATASGEASAAAGGKGGTAGAGQSWSENIMIYPMTETGLSAGGSIGGRKYWKDKDLN